jgi:hypothetical protein
MSKVLRIRFFLLQGKDFFLKKIGLGPVLETN